MAFGLSTTLPPPLSSYFLHSGVSHQDSVNTASAHLGLVNSQQTKALPNHPTSPNLHPCCFSRESTQSGMCGPCTPFLPPQNGHGMAGSDRGYGQNGPSGGKWAARCPDLRGVKQQPGKATSHCWVLQKAAGHSLVPGFLDNHHLKHNVSS